MTGDNSIDTKIKYSSILFYNKQYDKTIALVNEIMKTEASKDYMIRLLGYSYYEQGDSLAALNMMNKYFEKAPKDKIIFSDYQYLGKIYTKFGQDSLAFLNYEKAIATDSTRTELYNDLATMYYSKGKYLKAAEWYGKKLVKMDRPGLQNYFDVAFAYFKGEDYNSALREFGKISEKWPDRLEGHVYQGRSAAYLDPDGTNALAKPYYEKVIEKGEVDPVKYKDYLTEAYKYMFYASMNLKDKVAAKSYIDKVLKLNPNDEEAVQLLKRTE
jgi:tetratricopeptide (TPR) repeat protein